MDFRSPAFRIQFQKGLGLVDFLERFGSESQCRDTLFRLRWPDGFRCPACGSEHHWILGRPLIRCKTCRAEISLTSGTLFHCTKLPLTTWFLAVYLLTQTKTGISIPELKRHLQVNEKTAWLIQHKLMEAMRVHEHGRTLSGRVHLEAATLRKVPGTGSTGKPVHKRIPCLLAVQIDSDGAIPLMSLESVASFRHAVIQAWSRRRLSPDARIVKNPDRIRSGFPSRDTSHGRDGKTACLDDGAHRSIWTGILLSNFRSGLAGVRHLDLNRYPERFMALFQFRLNHRMDLGHIAQALLDCAARTGARTRWMLSQVESHGKSARQVKLHTCLSPTLHPIPG